MLAVSLGDVDNGWLYSLLCMTGYPGVPPTYPPAGGAPPGGYPCKSLSFVLTSRQWLKPSQFHMLSVICKLFFISEFLILLMFLSWRRFITGVIDA